MLQYQILTYEREFVLMKIIFKIVYFLSVLLDAAAWVFDIKITEGIERKGKAIVLYRRQHLWISHRPSDY